MGEYIRFRTPRTDEHPSGVDAVCARNHQCATRLMPCKACGLRLLRNDETAIEARDARGRMTAFYCDRNCADSAYAIKDFD